MSSDVRNLPAALESEADVLGSCLAEGESWWHTMLRIGGDTSLDLFHDPYHRIVASTAIQAEAEGGSFNISALLDRLMANPASEMLSPDPKTYLYGLRGQGKIRQLSELQRAMTALLEARHARKLMLGSDRVIQDMLDGETTSTETAAALRQLSMESGVEGEVRRFGEIIIEMESQDNIGVPWRAPSGIAALDEYLRGGFEPGRLYIVGARPKVGKTTALINFVLGALAANVTVVFASLEIGESELYAKILSAQSQVELGKITQLLERKISMDDFPPEEARELKEARAELLQAPLYTMFSPEITNGITSVLNKVMKVQSQRPGEPLILFVDYIQKLAKSEKQSDRSAEIGAIAWQSKRFSQDYGISVVMPAQLTRAAADEGGGMPGPHHLRESGNLEQDADMVLLLNRPRLQDPEQPEHLMHMNVALNRVGKSTQGEEEWIKAYYDPARQTIDDFEDRVETNFDDYEEGEEATGTITRVERRSMRSEDDPSLESEGELVDQEY